MELMSTESVILLGSVLLIAGVLIGKSSYKIGLPILLIFLLVGMLFGSDGLGIHFSDMHTAQFIGMMALCIILFSGGMGTKFSSIRPVMSSGLTLSTLGVVLTATLTGLFIWGLSSLSWTNIHFSLLASLLLASTMSSTDSASVFGILGSQKVGIKHNLRPMLELESGSNDPMAYMLTIILIQAINTQGTISGWGIAMELALQFCVGTGMGWTMGKAAIWLIGIYMRWGSKSTKKEDAAQATSMLSILILGMVFLTFSATTELAGNGYLAVYVCGIIIGNTKLPNHRGISKFMDGLTWLMQIVVFLMLGLLVNPHEMLIVAPVSLLIGAFMIVLGRPLSVMLCLLPFRKISFKSKMWISWVGLRGAVPIIFATYPVVAQIEGASAIFNIVFFITLLSLLIQGTTVIRSARLLGLTEKNTGEEVDFGVELADELPTTLHTITLSNECLTKGNTLRDMHLPPGQLVMIIKRGNRYIVPNGTRRLLPGDKLLVIAEENADNR